MRSPAVGPYDATYSEQEILAIETPSAQTPQAAHNTPALDRHELHFHGNAWLEPDGAARKHVQAFAPRLFPVELERGIDLGKMKMRPHLYWTVGPVDHRHCGDLEPGVDLDITLAIKDFAGDERFGLDRKSTRLNSSH